MNNSIHLLASVAVLCIASCSNVRDLKAERESIDSSIQAHQQAIRTLKRGAPIAQLPSLPPAIQRPISGQPVSPNQQRSFVSPRNSLSFRYNPEELTWSTNPGAIPAADNHTETEKDLLASLRGDQKIPFRYRVFIKPESLAATIEPGDKSTRISVAEWANYKAYDRLLQLRKELTDLASKARN
jgi:hypothetical protein